MDWKEFFIKVRYFPEDVWETIAQFFHRLGRSLGWAIFMWNNAEWDPVYLYQIMDKKLKEMRNSCNKYHSHTCTHHIVRIMDIALWYLDRLIKEDSYDNLYNLHSLKFGEITMASGLSDMPHCVTILWGFKKCSTPEQTEYAHKVLRRIHRIGDYRDKKYKARFFYILEKYIDWFWD